MTERKPFLVVLVILVAGLIGAAGTYAMVLQPHSNENSTSPNEDDNAVPYTNQTGPNGNNQTTPDDNNTVPDNDDNKTVWDDKNKTTPDDDNKDLPDDINKTVPDPVAKIPSHTYTGKGNGTTAKFHLYEGVTIIRAIVNQGPDDALYLALCTGAKYADNGTWTDDIGRSFFHAQYYETLIDPHIDGPYLGSYMGDLVVGIRGTFANSDGAFWPPGDYWLEVRCSGTWSFTVEQPRDVKGGLLPRTMHSEVGKTNYAFSIYIPAGTPSVRFTLTYDGPNDESNGIFPFLVSADGTERGPIVGGFDHDVTNEQMTWEFGNCYYEKGYLVYCDPKPGVYWIEVHDCSGEGNWTLTAELV